MSVVNSGGQVRVKNSVDSYISQAVLEGTHILIHYYIELSYVNSIKDILINLFYM